MRLAAQAKGGFYPTPDRVVDMIADLIHTPSSYYHRDVGDAAHPRPLLRGRRSAGATGRAPRQAQRSAHRDLRRRAAPGQG